MKSINVICPVFNEEDCIEIFFLKITELKKKIKNYNLNLIFTNNNSSDNTLKICKKICKENSWVKLISYTRNFGYQASILGGLKEFNADYYTIIDVDLQDPPEMIEKFLEIAETTDYQVVFGDRSKRLENVIISGLRKLFYKILKKVADQDFQVNMAEFFLITHEVKQNILKNNNTNIFLRNEVAYTGYKRKGIEFIREKRVAGKGIGESLIYMITFAFAGLIATSTLPLRISFYSLFPLIFINLFNFLNFIDASKLIRLLNWSFVFYNFAFISIYIARIHKDIINRPLYIIDYKNSVL